MEWNECYADIRAQTQKRSFHLSNTHSRVGNQDTSLISNFNSTLPIQNIDLPRLSNFPQKQKHSYFLNLKTSKENSLEM